MANYIDFTQVEGLRERINTKFLHKPPITKRQLYDLLRWQGSFNNFCEDFPPKPFVLGKAHKIQFIMLHTTASCNGVAGTRTNRNWDDSVVNTLYQHYCVVKTKEEKTGWSRPGYAFFIALDGTIYQLINVRSDGMIDNHTITFGAYGWNTAALHIVYDGGHKKCNPYVTADTRTQAQLESMERLVKFLLGKFRDALLIGHNQVDAKACPCFYVPAWACSIGISSSNIDFRAPIDSTYESKYKYGK